MNPLNATNKEIGFTLMEVLVTAVIIGILAAVGIPNLIAMFNKSQVQTGLDMLEGALEDAQRQAVGVGKNCTIEIRKSSASNTYYDLIVAKADPVTKYHHCFSAVAAQYPVEKAGTTAQPAQQLRVPRGVRIATNIKGTAPPVTFSFKGHIIVDLDTTAAKRVGELPTLVVFPVDPSKETPFNNDPKQPRKCIIVASLLGVLRTGDYDTKVNLPQSITNTKCTPSLDGREKS